MGGLNPPLRAFSQACIPPPKGGSRRFEVALGEPLVAFGSKPPKGNPFGGVSGVVPPQMAPLISGLLGSAGEYSLVALLPIFTDFSDFLGRLSSHSRVLSTLTTCLHGYMFFFRMMSSGEITSSIV